MGNAFTWVRSHTYISIPFISTIPSCLGPYIVQIFIILVVHFVQYIHTFLTRTLLLSWHFVLGGCFMLEEKLLGSWVKSHGG